MQDGLFHCHVKNVSRKKRNQEERSAVAAAAYVSGTDLWNERENRLTRFGQKSDVIYSAIVAPDDAPEWVHDREKLWNSVDASLKRSDARLAKSIEAAIIRDITLKDREKLLHDFVAPYITDGMVADIAIHDDGTNHNPHIHVMLTVNQLKPDGFGKKITNVDQKKFVTDARTRWEQLTNKYLEANGSGVRVDARSYKARGIEQQPTKHRGPNRQERLNKRILARQQREEKSLSNPTSDDRKKYPLLTQREDWPLHDHRPADLTEPERQEFTRYQGDRRLEAEQAAEEQFYENDVPAWFERTKEQAEMGETRPWYDRARENAQPKPVQEKREMIASNPRLEKFEQEQREDREYEKSVWSRAVNMGRTRAEHQLLQDVKHASPELRRRVENEILEARKQKIRQKDRQHERTKLQRDLGPSAWAKMTAIFDRSEVEPEPGPYNRPHSPQELDDARKRIIEENEREEEQER